MGFEHAPERKKNIERMEERVERLRAKAQGGSACSDTERVQTSLPKDRTIYLDAAADIQREIDKEMAILRAERAEAYRFMRSLPDPIDKQIIRMRYIEFISMTDIADALGYDQRWLRKKRARLLLKYREGHENE